MITEREKEILSLIQKNPMISQQDLADTLGITRSSIAVHITNLMKKGYIAGKGYIIKNENYITVIGGTNIDIQGFPNSDLLLNDSNPGKIKMSLGGVGRNIAENIVKLGIDVKLISALGDDLYGSKILEECKLSGIDMSHSLVLKNTPSSTYLSVLDESRDMKVAIAHMDIFDQLSVDFIREKSHLLKNAQLIVVDTNIPEETLHYLATHFSDQKLFLDTVSTNKALKVKDCIGAFHTIKPNKLEAEVLSGIKIDSDKDLEKACNYFLDQGVEQVFISLGKDGVYYANKELQNKIPTPTCKVINATGAGDAFMAGLISAHLNEHSIECQARFAIASSILALSHESTINPNFSKENVIKIAKEMNLCTNNI